VRLLFLNSVRGGGGGLRSAIELARGLANAGHDVHVACNRVGALRARLGEEPSARVHPIRIGPDYDPFAAVALARVLRDVRPAVAIADRRKDVKLLVSARPLSLPFPIIHRHGAPSTLRDNAAYRFFWTRVQAIVVNSHAMRAALVRAAPWLTAQRIEVIHNGVDTERFRARPDARMDVRAALGIARDAFVVVFHGVLQQRKRLALLLDAAARLGAGTHVLLVGAGPDADSLRARADALRIATTFTGPRDDVPALLSSADVFAHLSCAEGFSNSVLEALACGLPVVATNEHSHPEQVTEACGMLVAPVVEDVASALGAMRDDAALRARMAAAARTRAESVFPLPTMIDRYVRLMEQLA
jgi:glycosyltransferase involved in cell wall biosynthesis